MQPKHLDDLLFAKPLPLHVRSPRTDSTLLRESFWGAGHLTFIRRALEFGFTLEAIGELLGLAGGLRTCGDVYLVAERQLSEIRQRIVELSRMEAALAPFVTNCPRSGPARDCPLVVALSRPD
jgi:MerR family mercuric resistance operon transcriptional regulator